MSHVTHMSPLRRTPYHLTHPTSHSIPHILSHTLFLPNLPNLSSQQTTLEKAILTIPYPRPYFSTPYPASHFCPTYPAHTLNFDDTIHSTLFLHTLFPHCNTLQHTATHCNTLQHTATHCNTLQHTATHCTTLQHTATYLQHTATHCNILRHKS